MLWGKLPTHGDFVARGLAAAEREAIDLWLAGSLADARHALGAGFEAVYDQAPPWRFARAETDGWIAGAIAPSVDGVGRRYPVMVARAALAEGEVAGAAEAVEALLYEALAGAWDADRLVATAASAEVAPAAPWTHGDHWWTLGGEGFDEAALAGARPPQLMRSVLTMRQGEV